MIKGQRGRPKRNAVTLRSTQASLAFNSSEYDLDSEWFKCKTVVSQSQEICHAHCWIVSNSPVPQEQVAIGKIVDILQRIDLTQSIVILEQYLVQPERHEIFNMPFMAPRRREEAVFLILNPKVWKYS
jgi:hypothetical protein